MCMILNKMGSERQSQDCGVFPRLANRKEHESVGVSGSVSDLLPFRSEAMIRERRY